MSEESCIYYNLEKSYYALITIKTTGDLSQNFAFLDRYDKIVGDIYMESYLSFS